jgi:hypothetical protein
MGDFNEILYLHEKEGGNPRPQQYMNAFRDALVDCDLKDLGYLGDRFTWRRGRIRERLDRAVANPGFMNMMPNVAVTNMKFQRSDHRPILLDAEHYRVNHAMGPTCPRRFEARWLREEKFGDVVASAWEEASLHVHQGGVLDKLGFLHENLHVWDEVVLKKPRKQLQAAQRELERVMRAPMNDENDERRTELASRIERLLEQQEIHWQQRSRANWLHNGDKNTNYFHNYANARKKKNYIAKLKDDHGSWAEGDQLKPLIFDYFSNLFTSEVTMTDPAFLEKITPRISAAMNEKLTRGCQESNFQYRGS